MQNKVMRKVAYWATPCLPISFFSSSNSSHSTPSVLIAHWQHTWCLDINLGAFKACFIIPNLSSSYIQKQTWPAVHCWLKRRVAREDSRDIHRDKSACAEGKSICFSPVRFSPPNIQITWEASFSSSSKWCRLATALVFAFRNPMWILHIKHFQ